MGELVGRDKERDRITKWLREQVEDMRREWPAQALALQHAADLLETHQDRLHGEDES